MRRILAVVSSRILSIEARCLLTLTERIVRVISSEWFSDMGNRTCGVSSKLGIIDCPYDFVRRLPFREKLGDQQVSGARFVVLGM
jgi:hypothetical protein